MTSRAHIIPLLSVFPLRAAPAIPIGQRRVLAATRFTIGKMVWFHRFPLPMSNCLMGLVDDSGKAVGVYHFPHDRPTLN